MTAAGSTSPDLLVIGGGAAALSAVRTARRLGHSATMISDGPPGGDCTFTGCIPSKTLLASAHLPFPDAMTHVQSVISSIAADESADVLAREGVDVITGRAEAINAHRIEVGGRIVTPRTLVIATGSRPVIPNIPGLADVPYLTNENIFDLTALPEHLAILGGGAIGVEMAQAFRQFGSDVTIIEATDRLLGTEEPDASVVIANVFTRLGIRVRTRTVLDSVSTSTDGVTLHTSAGVVTASHLLIAVGRLPSTDGVGQLGLTMTPRNAIRVDSRMRTSMQGVYAAGDVTGRMPSTHAAHEMGYVAATNALRRLPLRFREAGVPRVTFTSPEVARVGLTETQAARRVRGARVVELPMADVDRARTSGHTDGFVKIIVGPRRLLRNAGGGHVLGATIVAERAGEMIAELALAMRTGMFTGRLAQTSHAYPTWSVAVQQAVAQLFGHGSRTPRSARDCRPELTLSTVERVLRPSHGD